MQKSLQELLDEQVALGWAYYAGVGQKQNRQNGLAILERAAKQGSLRALFRIAFFSEVEGNPQSIELFEALARKNYSPAVHELGNIYRDGILISKNNELAIRHWSRAAELGHNVAKMKILQVTAHEAVSEGLDSILIALRLRLKCETQRCFNAFHKRIWPHDDRNLGRY